MGARAGAGAVLVLALSIALRAAPAGAAAGAGRGHDAEAQAALSLVYDGEFGAAEARLADLARRHPEDPVLPYLQALALEWRLEQDAGSRTLDPEVLALADRALALADARLGRDAADARALLARGAAHGVKSRLHLFRWDRGPASREAVRMRDALARAREGGEAPLDLDFGLGLYDYYANTLPRFFKLVAFLLRIPGGDRDRGLEAIARVARGGSLFHDDEARVQMYDIHSYFERRPDRAVHWIREMWRRHPGWPRWGLKLAQLLGDGMGLWPDSAEVAREVLGAAGDRPAVGDMARALLAAALLGDLRVEEARLAAREVRDVPGSPWVAARRDAVLARCRALAGGAPEGRAVALLARARRLAEQGESAAAEAACLDAFRAHPGSDEGRLCAARASLRAGRPGSARALADAVLGNDAADPGLAPGARMVRAQALEALGEPRAALAEYRRAFDEPLGRDGVRAAAAAAIVRLDPRAERPDRPPLER